jgi:hypothetical protein
VLAASIIRVMITLMMEAETPQTLVIFYQNAWCYNPENSHIHVYYDIKSNACK